MPRETIDLGATIERLSVLDQDARLDAELEPEIPDETLKRMHRVMVLARRFDERLLQLQRQGRIGTFAPLSGQEAAQIGAAACLRDDDWMVPSFRETGAAIWRGVPLEGILVYNAGFNEGGAVADDQYTLPIAVPVASQLPHAVGLAYAARHHGEDRVAMTFFGDGATSEGDFHEALNFAGVWRAPVLFVCQNNHWAISLPVEKQTAARTIAQKALAYGLRGIRVDGNDVLAVYAASAEAVARSRAGGGPTLIECETYRMSVHTTADDPSRYRSEDEVEAWRRRDPIERFQCYLRSKGLLEDGLEDEVDEEIDRAWHMAAERIEALGDPRDMFEHVYAEMPEGLREQQEAVAGTRSSGAGDR